MQFAPLFGLQGTEVFTFVTIVVRGRGPLDFNIKLYFPFFKEVLQGAFP